MLIAQATSDGSMLLGDNLLPWLTLALGAALAVGTALALVRPRHDVEGSDLAQPPILRSLVMIAVGGLAALWAVATLLR